jgi:molybdopterin-guanine dinucleotide biosynthesis protein A
MPIPLVVRLSARHRVATGGQLGRGHTVDGVYDAIVLAGGSASRLGGAAKPQLVVAGQTLLDRAVAAVSAAQRIVVVGPDQPVAEAVLFCREDPPGGGPVAAIAAGLPHTGADVVVVLAADLPWIAPAIPLLVRAVPAAGAAVLLDASGRANYLAAAWRRAALEHALAGIGAPAGAAARALVESITPVLVADQDGWGRDCDTWEDLADARSRRKDPDA